MADGPVFDTEDAREPGGEPSAPEAAPSVKPAPAADTVARDAPDDVCLWCDRSLADVEWCGRCGFGSRPVE